ITGAVASNYQRERIEKMADTLEIEVFSPLWNMDQYDLVEELLEEGFQTMIVSVAAMGLDDSWLGRKIDVECISDLKALHEKYRINIAGEGGEYESLVLDGPMYDYGFKVVEAKKVWDGQRGTYDILKIEKK
ncbi:MAG: diphthine--ammonia ligase, partial [Thermoplasmatota archaeon]